MSNSLARLAAVSLAAGGLLAGASSAQAEVRILVSSKTTFWSQSVNVRVSSDKAQKIYVSQVRFANQVGPGRCWVTWGNSWDSASVVGQPLAEIDYTTPNVPVDVRIPATRLKFKGGDPKARTYSDPGGTGSPCRDFETKYTRIGAFQDNPGGYLEGVTSPLTRPF